MKRIIKLSDLNHIKTPTHEDYGSHVMDVARAALTSAGLRYDNKTGIVRDNKFGELERFCKQSDHVPMESEQEVMRWVFRRYISNAASRLTRGYEAH